MFSPSTYESLKRNAPSVVFFSGFFAIMFILAQNEWENDATPIRSVDPINATIEGVYWHWTSTSQYGLFLENNALVFVDDDRPRLIGSRVKIERVTRDNGSVFYRFAD
ncbi:hypothetical protein [Mesorhizobium sp. M8A.F.Ca.ET.021.01.1.1]|uniref:hypothetical protein n=1 Tax=Mesorhizobium sp. M8A.F.Ca.ET.021.01.1.1 TaxID=2496757 RepID=UPI000FCBA133|nr:hypothetical protein [Mesorhizobium sp. M8A.F.Ca.ET.021.01.1.1]RUW43852.1 hypothetical protein EOA36_33235 [Mesorhizobium sp. M8A.F.Ca.ET.021.01.1.1]